MFGNEQWRVSVVGYGDQTISWSLDPLGQKGFGPNLTKICREGLARSGNFKLPLQQVPNITVEGKAQGTKIVYLELSSTSFMKIQGVDYMKQDKEPPSLAKYDSSKYVVEDISGLTLIDAVVVSQDDGDTTNVKITNPNGVEGFSVNQELTIRYMGIDCPEYIYPGCSEYDYKVNKNKPWAFRHGMDFDSFTKIGAEAAKFTGSQIPNGSKIYLLIDPTNLNDEYNRTIACVYYKPSSSGSDRIAINLNKTLVLNGLADILVIAGIESNFNFYSWNEYLRPNHFHGHYTDGERDILISQGLLPKDSQKLASSSKKEYNIEEAKLSGTNEVIINDIDKTEENPLGAVNNLIPIDPQSRNRRSKVNSPYHFRIGDTELIVPPISISVSKNMHNKRINTLRSKGSVMTKTGHSDVVVEVELFFHNLESINGVKFQDGSQTYALDGLRPLLAQFKKCPFLPIENEYLNVNHDIWAATLVNLSTHTVPNFPNCLSVTLTMMKFDHTPFIPEQALDDVINYPLFRWFYQQSLKDRGQFKTHFKEATTLDKNIRWKLADKKAIEDIETAIKTIRVWKSPIEVASLSEGNSTYNATREESKIFNSGLAQQKRYNQVKADMQKKGTWMDIGPVWYGPQEKEFAEEVNSRVYQGEDPVFVFPGTILESDLWYSEDYGYKDYVKENPSSLPAFYASADQIASADNKAKLHPFYIEHIWKRDTTIDSDITKFYMVPIGRTDIIQRVAKGSEWISRGVAAYKEDFKQLQVAASLTEANLPMKDFGVEGLIIQSISVSMENVVVPLQMQQAECPTHQYLGSQDVYIQLKAQTVSEKTLRDLNKLFNDAESYSREHRWGITSGFLQADNNLLQLFGVNHVIVDSMNVNTVPNYPGLYDITITLFGFNKTQANTEMLKRLSNDVKNIEDLQTKFTTPQEAAQDDIIIELKMKELDLYPDLELPTFKELDVVLPSLGITADGKALKKYPNPLAAKFVDPDFYISTQETFRQKVQEIYEKLIEKPLDILMKDWNGLTIQQKSPTPENPDGTTILDSRIVAVSEAIKKEKGKYGQMPSKPNTDYDSSYDTASDSSPYENTSSSASGDTTVKITRDQLIVLPNVDEWVRWNGNTYQGSRGKVEAQGVINRISNPTPAEISIKIRSMVKQLFADCTKREIDDATAWIKGICEQESGWAQYTKNKAGAMGTYINDTSTAVGIMQLIPKWHVARVNGQYDLNDARRIAWGWEYNLYKGINYFHSKFIDCKKLSNKYPTIKAKPFWWAAVGYNQGNISGALDGTNKDGVNYANSVETRRNKYWNNWYADPGSNYNKTIEDAYTKAGEEKHWYTSYLQTASAMSAGKTYIPTYSIQDQRENAEKGKGVYELREKPGGGPSIEEQKLHEIFKGMTEDLVRYDMRGRLARAFPTFQMFLIDEGRYMAWYKMWDNFYGFNAIQSIEVMKSRKMAADTCIIEMTNVYSNLSERDADIKYGDYDYRLWDNFALGLPSNSMLEARSELFDSLALKTGARLHLRLGYGANGLGLPTVFNGTITELNTDEVITIVAQGDGIELCNKIIAEPGEVNDGGYLGAVSEPRELLCTLMGDRNSEFFAWLSEKAEKAGKEKDESADYLPGLLAGLLVPGYAPVAATAMAGWGLWKAGKELSETKTGQALLNILAGNNPNGVEHFGRPKNDSYKWPWQNEYGEIGLNIYAGNNLGTFGQWIHGQGDTDVEIGNKKVGDIITSEGSIGGVDFSGYWGLPWFAADEMDIQLYMYDKTIWDVGQTLAYILPEYIFTVVPFEFRSTAFFGKPYWSLMDKYGWKYVQENGKWTAKVMTTPDGNIKQYRKPFMQLKTYMSESDILGNYIKTSEDGVYTNVIVTYNTGEGDTPTTTDLISADTDIYPSKQKTAIVNADIKAEGQHEKFANGFGSSVLRDFLKEMYKGELVVIGDPTVKPHDFMYVKDTYQDMEGPCLVREVVHHFSFETGFITSITPDALVVTDDLKLMTLTNLTCRAIASPAGGWIAKTIGSRAWKKIPELRISKWTKEKLAPNIRKVMLNLLEEVFSPDKGKIGATQVYKLRKIFEKDPKMWVSELKALRADKATWTWLTQTNSKVEAVAGLAETISKSYKTIKTVRGLKTVVTTLEVAIGAITSSTGIGLIIDVVVMWAISSAVDWVNRFLRNRQACIVCPMKYKGKEFVAGINGHKGLLYGEPGGDVDKIIDNFFDSWGGTAVSLLGVQAPEYDKSRGK